MPKIHKVRMHAWVNFADFESINISIFGETVPENILEPGPTKRVKVNDNFDVIDRNKNFWDDGPTLRLTQESAQDLVNNLWDAGIRPIAAKGSSGQLEAVERHLKDMRHIAFDKMTISLPEDKNGKS